MVTARGGHLQRLPGLLLSEHVGEVRLGMRLGSPVEHRQRSLRDRFDGLVLRQVAAVALDDLTETAHGDDIDA